MKIHRRLSHLLSPISAVMAVAVVLGCSVHEPPPDEAALARKLAEVVIDDEVLSYDRVVVMHDESMAKANEAVRDAIALALEKNGPGWQTSDIFVDDGMLPGDWTQVRPGGKESTTHLFISFEVEGKGRTRVLHVYRTYGWLRGRGKQVRLSWQGGKWREEVVGVSIE